MGIRYRLITELKKKDHNRSCKGNTLSGVCSKIKFCRRNCLSGNCFLLKEQKENGDSLSLKVWTGNTKECSWLEISGK